MERDELKQIPLLAALCGALVLLLVLVAHVSAADLALYLSGSFACFLLAKLGRTDARPSPDYITSGEAALGTLFTLAALRFVAGSDPRAFLLSLPFILAMECYRGFVLPTGDRERFSAGVIINACFALFLLFFGRVDPSFSPDRGLAPLLGYAQGETGLPAVFLSLLPLLLLYAFFFYTGPQMMLFAQGEACFRISGFGERRARLIIAGLRGLLLAAVLYFIGWLGGGGYLFRDPGPFRVTRDIRQLLFLICWVQALALLAHFIEAPWIILAAVLTAYGHRLYQKKTRGDLYDRG